VRFLEAEGGEEGWVPRGKISEEDEGSVTVGLEFVKHLKKDEDEIVIEDCEIRETVVD